MLPRKEYGDVPVLSAPQKGTSWYTCLTLWETQSSCSFTQAFSWNSTSSQSDPHLVEHCYEVLEVFRGVMQCAAEEKNIRYESLVEYNT